MNDVALFPATNLARLREAHVRQLQAQTAAKSQNAHASPEHVAEIQALVLHIAITGTMLQDPLERNAAQSLLEFWQNALATRGIESDAELSAYEPARLDAQNEAIWAMLSAEDQPIAAEVLSALARISHSDDRRVYVEGVRLAELDRQMTSTSDVARRVLDRLAALDIITITSTGEQRDEHVAQLANAGSAHNWLRMHEWLLERRTRTRERMRLDATAEQWKRTGMPEAMLLQGEYLRQAERSTNLSPNETEFVMASRQAASKHQRLRERRKRFQVGIATAAALLLGALLYLQSRTFTRQRSLELAAQSLNSKDIVAAARSAKDAYAAADTAGARNALARISSLTSDNFVAMTRVHDSQVWGMDLSPDGQWLVSGDVAGQLQLGHVRAGPNGLPVTFTSKHDLAESIFAIAISSDSRYVAAGTAAGEVVIWSLSLPEPELLVRKRVSQRPVPGLAFRPGGDGSPTLASTSFDGSIKLLRFDPGRRTLEETQLVTRVIAPNNNPYWMWNVSFSPDGSSIAVAGQGNTLLLGHMQNAPNSAAEVVGLRRISTSTASVAYTDASFSPDGRWLVSTATDNFVRLWDVSTGQSHNAVTTQLGPNSWPWTARWSATSAHMAGGTTDGRMLFWDIVQDARGRPTLINRRQARTHAEGQPVMRVRFHPTVEPLVFSASWDSSIAVWDVRPDYRIGNLPGGIQSFAQRRDGDLVTVGADALIQWRDGQPKNRIEIQSQKNDLLRLSEDATRMVQLTDSGTFTHTELSIGYVWEYPFVPASDVFALTLNGTGLRVVALTKSGRIMWMNTEEIEDAQQIELPDFAGTLEGFDLSTDGNLVAVAWCNLRVENPVSGVTCARRTIAVYDLVRRSSTFNTFASQPISALAFDATAKRLASADTNGVLQVWELGRTTPSITIKAVGNVKQIAFHPRDAYIATAHFNDRIDIRLWELEPLGREIGLGLSDHTGDVQGILFNQDGTALYSAGQTDGRLIRWAASPNEWQSRACKVLQQPC